LQLSPKRFIGFLFELWLISALLIGVVFFWEQEVGGFAGFYVPPNDYLPDNFIVILPENNSVSSNLHTAEHEIAHSFALAIQSTFDAKDISWSPERQEFFGEVVIPALLESEVNPTIVE
jgi:hypothetical protein